MKNRLYFFAAFLLLLFNFRCGPPSLSKDGGLIVEIEVPDASEREMRTIEKTLASRVDYFFRLKPIVESDVARKTLTLKFPLESDSSFYRNVLTNVGKFEFLETYQNEVIYSRLQKINDSLTQNTHLFAKILSDTSAIGKNDNIFQYFAPAVSEDYKPIPGVYLGSCDVNATHRLDVVLNSESARCLLPDDIEFKWTIFSEKNRRFLVAVKKTAFIDSLNKILNPIFETQKWDDGIFINLKLRPEHRPIFEEFTRLNLGRTIALSLDDQIFSTPKISTPIVSGDIQFTTGFTDQRSEMLGAILKYRLIRDDLKIVSMNLKNVQ